MTQENNVVALEPQAPEPVGVDELRYAIAELHSVMTHERPLDDLKDDARAIFRRHAYCAGESAIDDIERETRVAMAKAHVDAKDVRAFKMTEIKKWAKETTKRLAQHAQLMAKRRARNAGITTAGITDDAAASNMGLEDEIVADAMSADKTLISIAWLNRNRRGRIWFDEFANNVYSDWDGGLDDKVVTPRPIDDTWRLKAYITLLRSDVKLAKLSTGASDNAIMSVAIDNTRNAARDWLRGLVWDSEPRLATWLTTVYGTPQDAYHAAVAKNWILGMVARIHKPGDKMDHMPVLIGGEGIRKSTSLEILGGKMRQGQTEEHYYGSINVSAEKLTDFLMTLNGLQVAEVPELDALMNKRTEHSRVKMIITTTEDIYRAPYGRSPSKHRRTCVLVGTTNEFHWNNFEGIGRRFWPFECNRLIDTEWLIANRDQLFAEAQAAYVAGDRWDVVPMGEHQAQMQEHKIDDPQAQRVEDWLNRHQHLYTGQRDVVAYGPSEDGDRVDEAAAWGNLITTSRLLTQAMQMLPATQLQSHARKVSSIMRNLGWKSEAVRLGSGREAPKVRAWIRSDAGTQEQGQLFDKTDE
jgi:predicted P-loop ATPase